MYYPNILHIIGPSQILHTQAHKLLWTLSQILPIISHISSNLNSPQNMLIISLPKLGRKITLSPHKAQHHLACGQNSKKAQIPKSHYDVANSKSPTTIWLIPKSHYDVANSKVPLRCDQFQSPTTMWLIPKVSLRCG